MKLMCAFMLAAVSLAPALAAQSKLPAPTPLDVTVTLTWDAPAPGDDPVVGYGVFRSIGGGWAEINAEEIAATEFVDAAPPICGCMYYGVIVDADGNQSAPSNTAFVTVSAESSARGRSRATRRESILTLRGMKRSR